jgi:pimeloyl-ACP methyl ester carboxylesterase
LNTRLRIVAQMHNKMFQLIQDGFFLCVMLAAVLLSKWAQADEALPPKVIHVGKGPAQAAILYLHPWGGSADLDAMRSRIVDGLGRQGRSFKLVAPWIRPVKLDDKGKIANAGDQTISYGMEQVRKAMKDIDGPVIVMGHSMGGLLGLYCQQMPEFKDKIKATVCFAPSVCMLKTTWKHLTGERELPAAEPQNLDRMRAKFDQLIREKEEIARNLDREGKFDHANNTRGYISHLRVMKDLIEWEPKAGSIPKVTTPTLVFYGEQDEDVSHHYLDRLANKETNPGVTAIRFPGVDHGLLVGENIMANGKKIKRIIDEEATGKLTQNMCQTISGFIAQQLEGDMKR